MSDITVPRKQVLLCALSNKALRMKKDSRVYRIDPQHALARMLNGYDEYELTTVTIIFGGEVNLKDMEVRNRLEQ